MTSRLLRAHRAELALALAILDLSQLVPVDALRAAIALPILLVLPGFATLRAAGRPAGLAASWAVVPLVSLAIVSASVLVLDLLSIAIDRGSLLVALNIVVVLLLALPERQPSLHPVGSRLRLSAPIAAMLCSFAATAVALAAVMDPNPNGGVGYNEVLFLTPKFDRGASIVRSSPKGHLRLPVGVHAERHPRGLEVRASFRTGPAWTPARAVLDRDGTWIGSIDGFVPRSRCINRLTIALVGPAGSTLRELAVRVESGQPRCRAVIERTRSGGQG